MLLIKALHAANGKYIAWLNSDDVYRPEVVSSRAVEASGRLMLN